MSTEKELKISIRRKILAILHELLDKWNQLYILKLIEKTAREAGIVLGSQVYKEGLAVIEAESQFNPNAKYYNKDGSWDLGLCQFNNYWYWRKEQIIPPADALIPEKALPVFWQYFPKRKNDWIAYRNKSYVKYMDFRF